MASAALCELSSADFVAGAALCEPSIADFVAGAALCELSSADFVAGAALCEPSSADRRQDRESRITSPGERGRRRTILLETAFEKAVGNSIGKHESRNESRITLLEVLVETAFEKAV